MVLYLCHPRYFDNLLKEIDEDFYEKIKKERKKNNLNNFVNSSLNDEDYDTTKKLNDESKILDKEIL